MRVNIITNFNGVGLQRDAELLKPVLESFGHTVNCAQFTNGDGAKPADANIFMEVIVSYLFRYAPRQFLFVNPEWFPPEFNAFLPQFERVFCKTLDAERIFSRAIGKSKCVMTGFYARDLYDPNVPRMRDFLHIAGKSQTKNTDALIECWRQAAIPQRLNIVGENYPDTLSGAIRFHKRLTDDALRRLMNECWFHLMPSQYEGYGHAIHESMGCGAVVMTTNGPPMNEIEGLPKEVYVRPFRTQYHYSGLMQIVTAGHVLEAVRAALALPDDRLPEIGRMARKVFESEKPRFVEKIRNFFPADGPGGPSALRIEPPSSEAGA